VRQHSAYVTRSLQIVRLTPEGKLDLLRELHPQGKWTSLDDSCYCTACQRLITGRQIEVVNGANGIAHFRLQCPSTTCQSTPPEWIKPITSRDVSFLLPELTPDTTRPSASPKTARVCKVRVKRKPRTAHVSPPPAAGVLPALQELARTASPLKGIAAIP